MSEETRIEGVETMISEQALGTTTDATIIFVGYKDGECMEISKDQLDGMIKEFMAKNF